MTSIGSGMKVLSLREELDQLKNDASSMKYGELRSKYTLLAGRYNHGAADAKPVMNLFNEIHSIAMEKIEASSQSREWSMPWRWVGVAALGIAAAGAVYYFGLPSFGVVTAEAADPSIAISSREEFQRPEDPAATCKPIPSAIRCRLPEELAEQLDPETRLKKQVEFALESGGSLKRTDSLYRPTYKVLDCLKEPVAIFKPEDERNWGPSSLDPAHRRSDPTNEDIYRHQMDSFEQGRCAQRQYLANQLDPGAVAKMPTGIITEMTSNLFIDPDCKSDSCPPREMTKTGYLQEWKGGGTPLIDYEPYWFKCMIPPYCSGKDIESLEHISNPVHNLVPLTEFQKVGIMDALLYNQDRNPANILVHHEDGVPHYTPVDLDGILPMKLEGLRGIFRHSRAEQAFTPESMKMIEAINPEHVAVKIRTAGFPEQLATNGRALAMVLKQYAASGKTLSDVYKYIALPKASSAPDSDPALWQDMTDLDAQTVKSALSTEDLAMRKHFDHVSWLKWSGESIPDGDGGENWLKDYVANHQHRIESTVSNYYWDNLKKIIDTGSNS